MPGSWRRPGRSGPDHFPEEMFTSLVHLLLDGGRTLSGLRALRRNSLFGIGMRCSKRRELLGMWIEQENGGRVASNG